VAVMDEPWMCLMCGYMMTAYSPMEDGPDVIAKEGDVSICLNCGTEYMRAGTRWRLLTAADRAAIDAEARALLDRAAAVRPAFKVDLTRGRGSRA
jgi:hypothetical protein